MNDAASRAPNGEQNPLCSPWLVLAMIAGAYLFLFLPLIALGPIGGSSEAREAHVARIIYESDSWILPIRAGFVPSKPLLYHWCVAGLGVLFGGVNEFVARFVSLLAASLVMLVTCGFAMRHARRAVHASFCNLPRVALMTAVALSLGYQFCRLTGDARVDMCFSLPVTAAILFFLDGCILYLAGEGDLERLLGSWRLTLFYASAGIAVLAKGPLGLVLPVVIAGAMYWYLKGIRNSLRFFLTPRIGWAVFLCIALPWYLLAATKGNDEFIGRQLVFENLKRFIGGEDVNEEPVWFYVRSFLVNFLPWSILFVALLWAQFQRAESRARVFLLRAPSVTHSIKALLAIGLVTGVVFFSLASGKRHSYLLPLSPLLALFLAWSCEDRIANLEQGDLKRAALMIQRTAGAVFMLLLMGGGALAFYPFPTTMDSPILGEIVWYLRSYQALFLVWFVTVLLVVGILRLPAVRLYLPGYAEWMMLLSAFVGVLYLGISVKNHLKGFERFAEGIRIEVPSDQLLNVIRTRSEEYFDPLLFYLDRSVVVVAPELAAQQCRGTYIAVPEHFEVVRAGAEQRAERIEVLHRYRQLADTVSGRGDRDIILFSCHSGTELPEGLPRR